MKSFADWLTPRRLRAQALILALCLWGVCAVDFATPGRFDRAGNIKFQDFLPIYAAARMVAQGRAAAIYDDRVMAAEMESIIGQPLRVRLPYLYGPQIAQLFVPLAKMSFTLAAEVWVALSVLIYGACVYLVWKVGAPFLAAHFAVRSGAFSSGHKAMVALAAVAYPPLFHFFVRGQNSALALICLCAAYIAFEKHHDWLAGIALGFLIFKPQFLVAIPLVLLLSFAWKSLAGLVLSASAQIGCAFIYFGSAVTHTYIDTLEHATRWLSAAELSQAAIQMHSLRSFWMLLIPSSEVALALYFVCGSAVILIATAAWKSSAPLALRFSALMLAAVLVSPHLFVYDLLVFAPVFLLLANWILENRSHSNANATIALTYLASLVPLFGPLARWTHVQISVPVFVALLWILWRTAQTYDATAGHKLASAESRDV